MLYKQKLKSNSTFCQNSKSTGCLNTLSPFINRYVTCTASWLFDTKTVAVRTGAKCQIAFTVARGKKKAEVSHCYSNLSYSALYGIDMKLKNYGKT